MPGLPLSTRRVEEHCTWSPLTPRLVGQSARQHEWPASILFSENLQHGIFVAAGLLLCIKQLLQCFNVGRVKVIDLLLRGVVHLPLDGDGRSTDSGDWHAVRQQTECSCDGHDSDSEAIGHPLTRWERHVPVMVQIRFPEHVHGHQRATVLQGELAKALAILQVDAMPASHRQDLLLESAGIQQERVPLVQGPHRRGPAGVNAVRPQPQLADAGDAKGRRGRQHPEPDSGKGGIPQLVRAKAKHGPVEGESAVGMDAENVPSGRRQGLGGWDEPERKPIKEAAPQPPVLERGPGPALPVDFAVLRHGKPR